MQTSLIFALYDEKSPLIGVMWYPWTSQNTGAIAQLGERLPCTQEVRGSIPRSSTTISL